MAGVGMSLHPPLHPVRPVLFLSGSEVPCGCVAFFMLGEGDRRDEDAYYRLGRTNPTGSGSKEEWQGTEQGVAMAGGNNVHSKMFQLVLWWLRQSTVHIEGCCMAMRSSNNCSTQEERHV